jgi:hypothetical protein
MYRRINTLEINSWIIKGKWGNKYFFFPNVKCLFESLIARDYILKKNLFRNILK